MDCCYRDKGSYRDKSYFTCAVCRLVLRRPALYLVRFGTKQLVFREWEMCSFPCYRAHLAGY